MHWDGEDNDGFIQAYQYRYVTYHRLRGDSVVHDWQATTGTSLTIAFESSDILNYQVFQVRAVDNDGAADPSPAEKRFYTKRAIFPVTELIRPTDNTEFFAVDEVTDWWPGIQLTFTAREQHGEIVEYAWAVDGSDWNWTNDTTVFVPLGLLQPPVTGTHIVRVTCRDNTNLVDPDGDSARVRLVRPSFTKRIE